MCFDDGRSSSKSTEPKGVDGDKAHTLARDAQREHTKVSSPGGTLLADVRVVGSISMKKAPLPDAIAKIATDYDSPPEHSPQQDPTPGEKTITHDSRVDVPVAQKAPDSQQQKTVRRKDVDDVLGPEFAPGVVFRLRKTPKVGEVIIAKQVTGDGSLQDPSLPSEDIVQERFSKRQRILPVGVSAGSIDVLSQEKKPVVASVAMAAAVQVQHTLNVTTFDSSPEEYEGVMYEFGGYDLTTDTPSAKRHIMEYVEDAGGQFSGKKFPEGYRDYRELKLSLLKACHKFGNVMMRFQTLDNGTPYGVKDEKGTFVWNLILARGKHGHVIIKHADISGYWRVK